MEILLVRAEMLRQVLDPFAQYGDLNSETGIVGLGRVCVDSSACDQQ